MGKKWNTLPGAPVPSGTKGSLVGRASVGGGQRLPKADTTPPKVARPGWAEGKHPGAGSDKGVARPGGAQKLR